MKQDVTPRQQAFLDKLREVKGEASYDSLAKMMGVSQQAVSTMAARLIRGGHVKRIMRSESRLRLIPERPSV